MAEKYEGYSSWIISTHIIVGRERGVHGQISRSAGHAALTKRKESSGGVIKKFQDAANAHFKLRTEQPRTYLLASLANSRVKDYFRLLRFTQSNCLHSPPFRRKNGARFNGISATVHGSMRRLSVGGVYVGDVFPPLPSSSRFFFWTPCTKLLILSAGAKTMPRDFKIFSFLSFLLSRRQRPTRNQGIRHSWK